MLKWGVLNKKGGLAILSDFLKWGVLNKKYLAEKNGKKIKVPPPHNSAQESKCTDVSTAELELMSFLVIFFVPARVENRQPQGADQLGEAALFETPFLVSSQRFG